MKKTSTLGLLAGCQLVVAVALAALCAYHVIYARVLEQNSNELAAFQQNSRVIETLVGMSVEYGQANPGVGTALSPLLNRLGIKLTTNAPAKSTR